MLHHPLRLVLASALGTALAAQAPPIAPATVAVPAGALVSPRPAPRSLEELLPDSTYAVCRFGGLAACRTVAAELPMAAVVQAFLQRVPAAVREQRIDPQLAAAVDRVQWAIQQAGIRPQIGLSPPRKGGAVKQDRLLRQPVHPAPCRHIQRHLHPRRHRPPCPVGPLRRLGRNHNPCPRPHLGSDPHPVAPGQPARRVQKHGLKRGPRPMREQCLERSLLPQA
jgi:hypothetical protein